MWTWEAEQAQGVIVMVHGTSEHHGRYEWLIEKWRTYGFHVVMGDLPGQGQTTRRRGHIDSFEDYIEAVTGWIEAAETYQLPVFLFGHSLGGLIVIRAMVEKRFLVRGVILSSPCTGILQSPPKALKAAAWMADGIAPKMRVKLKSSSSNPKATRNQEQLSKDAEDPLIVKRVSLRWYNELEKAMKLASTTVKDFPDVPVLVVQAGDDKIIDQRSVVDWFNRIPSTDRTYKEWDGLYHELFNEPEREQVFRYASGFITMHLPPS